MPEPNMDLKEVQQQPEGKDRQTHEKFLADAGMVPDSSKQDSIRDTVNGITKQLGSPKYNVREEASKNLEQLGLSALPYIKEGLSSKDAEVRSRSESFVLNLLNQYGGPPYHQYQDWKDGGYKLSECPRWLNNLDNPIKNDTKDRTKQFILLRDAIRSSASLSKEHGAGIDNLSQQIEGQMSPTIIKQKIEREVEQDLSEISFDQFDEAPLTDDSLKILQMMKNLRTLDLTGAKQVTDKGLENLKNLTNLETVELSETQATDKITEHLSSSSRSLRKLTLPEAQITDLCLTEIAKKFPNLEHFSASRTNITDKGIAALGKLRNLKSLMLTETNISDAGISKLTGLTNLETLYLTGTKVTKEGAANFKKAVPNCSIWGSPY